MLLAKIIRSIITNVFWGDLYIHEQPFPRCFLLAVCVHRFVCGYKCAWVPTSLLTHIEARGQQRILPLGRSASCVAVILRQSITKYAWPGTWYVYQASLELSFEVRYLT